MLSIGTRDKAIRTEIDSIKKNNTWTLVDLPKGAKPIGCKWIFKKKYHPDGSIEKYKARLVAKGFSQKPNIDYFNTFAPVTRISSIRVLLALASIHKLVIHQMDVKTTFLNGEVEEEIYMTQPEGCVLLAKKKRYANFKNLCMGLNKHQNNGMKNLIMFYYVMVFLLMMLINVCTLN